MQFERRTKLDPTTGFETQYTLNELGQPVGLPAPPEASTRPQRTVLSGTHCELRPLSTEVHAHELFEAFSAASDGRDWTYLPYGPFSREADFVAWSKSMEDGDDPLCFVVIDAKGKRALGVASLMRIVPEAHCIEVGHIHYAPALQRTPAATEATYLLARHVFEQLGFQRLEWKCDALNERSRNAALRFGFQFEGVFRKHTTYKGRQRDTAWFSMLAEEWPVRREELSSWLATSNFDEDGRQLRRLHKFGARQ